MVEVLWGKGSRNSKCRCKHSCTTCMWWGGLVFKARRLLYHSTLGSRVTKKKKKKVGWARTRASALLEPCSSWCGAQALPMESHHRRGPTPKSWGGSSRVTAAQLSTKREGSSPSVRLLCRAKDRAPRGTGGSPPAARELDGQHRRCHHPRFPSAAMLEHWQDGAESGCRAWQEIPRSLARAASPRQRAEPRGTGT